MASTDRREALRGVENETFDLLAEALTPRQWTDLLKAPLERAAFQGNRGLAQKLLRAGAEIGEALHAAAQGGHDEVANDLLENGASINAKNENGLTPLHDAARRGYTDMVQLLLLKGADKDALDNRGRTPLYLATLFGDVTTALALMAAGADVNLQSRVSVVQMAVKGGEMAIVMAAIEHGADVNAVDSQNQETALHVATVFHERIAIDALVKAGADVNARDIYGCTALHNAAGRLNLDALLALLEHGADLNAQDEDQDTPLHWAAAKARTHPAAKVVGSLLRAGADETILNDEGKAAADVVGIRTEDVLRMAEDVDHVRKLLTNAPADRAWRRRGYLVLCRAHPGRVQQTQDITSAQADMARGTRSRAKKGKTEASDCRGDEEAGPVDERGIGDWAVVLAKVLGLQEEGIFRTIVGHV